jgi:hypothetical protein
MSTHHADPAIPTPGDNSEKKSDPYKPYTHSEIRALLHLCTELQWDAVLTLRLALEMCDLLPYASEKYRADYEEETNNCIQIRANLEALAEKLKNTNNSLLLYDFVKSDWLAIAAEGEIVDIFTPEGVKEVSREISNALLGLHELINLIKGDLEEKGNMLPGKLN